MRQKIENKLNIFKEIKEKIVTRRKELKFIKMMKPEADVSKK